VFSYMVQFNGLYFVEKNDWRTLEARAALKIHKIEQDRLSELEREWTLAQQNDRISLDMELRKVELEKLKETSSWLWRWGKANEDNVQPRRAELIKQAEMEKRKATRRRVKENVTR
jgi:hypothetical protein